MKKLLIIIGLLSLLSCGQEESSATDKANKNASLQDTLRVDTSIDFVTGQFDFKTHTNFLKVDSKYANKEIYLHKKTCEAFKAMADSAKTDGIDFTIVSGTRNFNYQKSIWDRKWTTSDASSGLAKAKQILEYSSMPMTSRHHWGTDIDINDLNNSYFESGQGKKEYEWLKAHANDFGFYQPYTDKSLNGRTGYNEEKWHWSYMPLAGPYLQFYNNNITDADITGFKGSELAGEIKMVETYVNGVSRKVKEYSR